MNHASLAFPMTLRAAALSGSRDPARMSAIRSALVGLCLLVAQGLACAQISIETAEILLRKSGAWAQLADMSHHVKAGITQSPLKSQLSGADIARLERLADAAFAAAPMRARAVQTLSVKMGELHSREALRWLDSPTGRMITAVEEAVAAAKTDPNVAMQEGNRILAAAPDGRRAELARIVRVSRMAEGVTAMQINIVLGVFQGLAAALPDHPVTPLAQVRAELDAQRPTMVAAMGGISLALLADMYKSVSDKVLELYAGFLATEAGSAFTAAMMESIDHTLTHACLVFGQSIPRAPKHPADLPRT